MFIYLYAFTSGTQGNGDSPTRHLSQEMEDCLEELPCVFSVIQPYCLLNDYERKWNSFWKVHQGPEAKVVRSPLMGRPSQLSKGWQRALL